MTITSQSYVLDPDTHEWVFEDGRRIPIFAGGDDGDGAPAPDAIESQPDGDDDPGQQQSKPPTQPGKAKEKGAAPWAKDLEAIREAEDPYAWADEYLRSNVQPRMTQHEQSVAEFTKMFGDVDTARLVSQLMADLDGDPKGTLQRLAKGFEIDPLDLLEEIEEQQGEPDKPEGKDDSEPEDPRLAYVQQQMEREQQAKQDEALENLLKGFEDELPGFDRDLYVYLLKAHDFDAEQSLEAYMKWHKEPEPADDPPPTGGGQKGTTPREAPKYGKRPIAEAMAGFFRDSEAAKA